jgi:hypothetical protein
MTFAGTVLDLDTFCGCKSRRQRATLASTVCNDVRHCQTTVLSGVILRAQVLMHEGWGYGCNYFITLFSRVRKANDMFEVKARPNPDSRVDWVPPFTCLKTKKIEWN